MTAKEDEWLHGWDATTGIVSVWAETDGRALVWRRDPETLTLKRHVERFRPWLLLSSLADLNHLGGRLVPEGSEANRGVVTYRELRGAGLRYLVRGDDLKQLQRDVLRGARARLGRKIERVRELGDELLVLSPEEQYLVETGRTYFKGLEPDQPRRLQFDLETTGLDPDVDRVFLIAVRAADGSAEALEAAADDDASEADLILRFAARVRELDPDVIENHNLHGFDMPFLMRRAERLRVRVLLGREAPEAFRLRAASRGARLGQAGAGWVERLRRMRYTIPGRELLDSMDAVRRHDFSARDLPGHGLKAVARHLGLASEQRQYIPGGRVFEAYQRDPELVRRYAKDDVHEAAGVARLLGGASYALSQMVPRRYERLADAGAATGIIDPLLVRAYLREGAALPAHAPSDGTPHQGAALYLFASGVATQIVKADVASLYPSLMRQYRIGPSRDELGVFLSVVDRLVERRLRAKARSREAVHGSAERFQLEAESAAIKLVVNSAYGYLGAVGLTRFADVHAANEVTRHGRELLQLMCRELALRGVELLEADTDGVYFAAPAGASEAEERRIVAEVRALLPPLVDLQFEGRYAAMLSHEPKNYALKSYDGAVTMRGVAFRSSRAEPFGEAFLRRALDRLLDGDLPGVRTAYVRSVAALRRRELPTFEVCSRVRLTKTPDEYLSVRDQRQELTYEALLVNGREHWSVGERVYVYRRTQGRAGLWVEAELDESGTADFDTAGNVSDARDYDVEHYVRQLRVNFASRLERGVNPEDFEAIVADPDRPSLFKHPLEKSRPALTRLQSP